MTPNKIGKAPGVEAGEIPQLSIMGTVAECGLRLGAGWREALREQCRVPEHCDRKPWWEQRAVKPLVETHAPHLPVLFENMAKGAGMPIEHLLPLGPPDQGCTTFAIEGRQTIGGYPLCGQTKDTPSDRTYRYLVLCLEFTDAPALLTLTYPGWLFGHGFAAGRCSIWRNSLNTKNRPAGLALPVWGLLAMHCRSVAEVAAMTLANGIDTSCHSTVVDSHGGIAGIECTDGGIDVLEPENGIYVHANAVRGKDALRVTEIDLETFKREESFTRERRFRELAEAEQGRITPQKLMAFLGDHSGHPVGICRHQSDEARTTAAVVAEPAAGVLHVVRGNPCSNWSVSYALHQTIL